MKKQTGVLLASILFISVLAACGAEKESEKPADNDKTHAEQAKFTISMRTNSNKYVETSQDINEDRLVKELEKRSNTDLNIRLISHNDFDQKMAQMFATNDIPDVVQSNSMYEKDMAGSVSAGVFMPLDDLLQKHGQNLLKKIPKEAWDWVKHEGKIMAIPEWLTNMNRRATFIRMDLLEKTGLPVPKTVDDYLNVMRAFKKLGVEQPFGVREGLKYGDIFFGAYDVYPYQSMYEQKGDQIQPKFMNTDRMIKAIETYKTMFNEGLMHKEFATINSTNLSNSINSGKVGIWAANANLLPSFQTKISAAVPGAKIAIIPSPVGPDGKGGNFLYKPAVRYYFINKNVKDPAAIIKFFDWMVSDEAAKFFTYGLEGENYTAEDGKIVYNQPKDEKGALEEAFRSDWLWMVKDATYNKGLLEQTDSGKELINVIDNILTKEGRAGIQFNPSLQAKNPDVILGGDTAAPLLTNHIIKMIYGAEPVSDWPKVLDEWKSKGGNEIIKEATERFNNESGIVVPQN